VWNAHLAEALKGGLPQAEIDVIGAGGRPDFQDPDAGVVYDYATTLLATHRVPQDLHDQAAATFGETGVVELVGVIGYYSLVTLTVNGFAFPLQPGAKPIFGEPG
jgi:4-carboxymuconolactone decarboxylase